MSGASDALSLKSSSIGVGNVDVAPVSFRLVTATDAETQEGVLSIAPDTAETSGTRVDVLAEQFKVGDTVHVTPGNVAIGGNVSIVAHDADADVVGTVTAGRGTFGAVSIDGVGDVKQRFDTFMQSSTRLYVSGSRGSDDIDVDGRSWDKPLASIKEACGRAAPGTTIFVESGQYTEDNPIRVPAYVAIVGDNLRRVVVYAQNPRVDMLHVNNSCYVVGLRFLNLQRPAFCAAFPCAVADTTLEDGSLASVELLWAPEEPYDDGAPPEVFVESPDDPVNGTRADIQAVLDPETHRLVDLEIVDPGSGYVTRPHVSIPPPDAVRPFIVTSPYIQNCSSITGPFTKSTGELIPATTPLPYDTSDVDDEGAGGGLRVDGRCCAASSPLRSFVTDSFTQLNAGGPGHMIFGLNSYCQFVSSFTTFCRYGFKAVDGGACNISTSVCDFGLAGLVSKSYWPEPVTTATLAETYRSGIVVRVTEGGSGYADPPTVVFSDGDAEAEAVLVDGKVESVLVIVQGEYETPPTVTFEGEADVDAEAEAVLLGRALIRIEGVSGRKPDIGSVTKYRETWYRVTSAAVVDAETYDVGVFPAFVAGDQGDPVEFVVSSIVATGQHTMEYVGSGCTFNALPQYGGQPDPSYHVVETPPGKVYYGISDELGNQKFGPFFSVAQATGEVSISTDRFNLSGISSLGPFRRLGIAVGVQLREVSLDPSLRSSTGLPDSSTVPTQTAVISYVTNAIEALQQNGVFENVSGNGEGLFGVLAANVVGLEDALSGDISCNSVQANTGVFVESLAANVVAVGVPGGFEADGRPIIGISQTATGGLRYDGEEHLFYTDGVQSTWFTADGITTTGDLAVSTISANGYGLFGLNAANVTGTLDAGVLPQTIGDAATTVYYGDGGLLSNIVTGDLELNIVANSVTSNAYYGNMDAEVVLSAPIPNSLLPANIVAASVAADTFLPGATYEKVMHLTNATGTVEHDVSIGAAFIHTNILENFTVNFVSVHLGNLRSATFVLVLVQGAAAGYMATSVQIQGAPYVVKWRDGLAPTGTANAVDTVTFTLIRTEPDWIVLGRACTFA